MATDPKKFDHTKAGPSFDPKKIVQPITPSPAPPAGRGWALPNPSKTDAK